MEAALGLDLGSLLSQLAATQQAKSSAKLSERNIVELINKLRQLGILSDGELLYTVNGKEYVTVECLRTEIQTALRQAGGRLALVELPAIVGVDYIHCERQAAAIVAGSGGTVLEVQGELITTQYFDTIAVEINDQLQDAGQLNIGDLAAQYGLTTELVLNTVTSRLGTPGGITGRLEGGLLYTPAYLRALKAQLRGALRAASSPTPLAPVLRELAAAGGGGGEGGGGGFALAGGGGGGIVASLIEELVAEGALRGSLKGGGSAWAPAVFGEAAAEAVAAFYSQNGWVGYDMVRRMGIPNERAHLRSAFPEGLPLESAYVAASLAAGLEAAVEDVLSYAGPSGDGATGATGGGGGAGWVDVGPLLPSVLSAGDVAVLLGRVPALKEAESRPPRERKAHVVCGTLVVSAALVAQLQARADAEARAAADRALRQRAAGGGGAAAASSGAGAAAGGGGGAQKKGGGGGADDDDDWSMGKKGGKGKGKGGKGGGAAKGGGKEGSKAAGGGGTTGQSAGSGGAGISAAQLAGKLPEWCPDLDWEGEGGGDDRAAAVAALLLPAAVAAYDQALQAAFTAGAEERRRAKDALSRAFEEAYGRLQLYGAGAESYSDDEPTHAALQRHTLRTAGAECTDLLHRWARVEHVQGQEGEAGQEAGAAAAHGAAAAAGPLSAAEVKQILRSVPPDVAEGLAAAAEAPAAADCRAACDLLERAAAAVGVRAKRLDKKGEKAALAALRERLLSALSGPAGADPPAALGLLVQLAHLRAAGKALTPPGKALGPVLARLASRAGAAGGAGAAAAAGPGGEEAQGGGGGGGAAAEELRQAVGRLAALHGGVVDYLKAQSGSGPGADTAAMLERLTEQLPPIKSALGLQAGGAAAGLGEAGGGGAAAEA